MTLIFIYLWLNAFIGGYMYRDQSRFRKDFVMFGQMFLLLLFGIFFMIWAVIKTKKK